ncbi:MAG: hypothetical protein KF708_14235 [Pirellulales bacterium]|nr:hypothetical protein [Pirellulales bacterium]
MRNTVRLFVVVALAVFLITAALLSRSTVRYTANVPVDLGPVLRAAAGEAPSNRQAASWTSLGKLVAPGGMLADAISQSGFDAELQLDESSSWIAARDSQGRAIESRGHLKIVAVRSAADRLTISCTNESRDDAAAQARLAAELIADRFVQLESQSVAKVYENTRHQAAAAREKFEAADAKLDELLANHFQKMQVELKKSPAQVSPENSADALTQDEELVGDPTVGAAGVPAGMSVAQLEKRLAQLETQRAALLEKLTPLHPIVRAADDEISTVKEQLARLRGGASSEPQVAKDAEKPAEPTAENPEVPSPGSVADFGGKLLPPWMQVGPGTPQESVPPPAAPPSTVEAPIVAPEEQPQVTFDRSTAEELETAVQVDTGALDKARAYLAETDHEYQQTKEARSAAQDELARQSNLERKDWLRLERLEEARPMLGAVTIETAAPPQMRRSILVAATLGALVLGIVAAWGGAVASASFGSIAEVEDLLGVPVVGVIETLNPTGSHQRTKRIRTWTGRLGIACEMLLVAAIVWLAYHLASEPGFLERLLHDPFETLIDTIW